MVAFVGTYGHNEAPIPPEYRPVSRQTDDFRRVLVEDWEVDFEVGDDLYRVLIPAGSEYSASVPGLLSPILPASRCDDAAALHDYLYRIKGEAPAGSIQRFDSRRGWVDVEFVSQRWVDRAMIAVMRRRGVSPLRRRLTYAGIRLGGWLYWNDVIQ